MQSFFDELCDMFGLKYNDFWVTYQGRPCQSNTLAYSLPHGAWMSINFRCHGGGKRGHPSKKAEKEEEVAPGANPFKESEQDFVKDTDGKLFESVFNTATDARTIVVDDLLNSMSIVTLSEMSAVLAAGGKTNHMLKIKMAVDNMPFIKDMVTVKDKLTKSIEMTKTKIAAAIWEYVCSQSDDQQFDMTILKMNVAATLKAKKAAMQD